jgi:hypothetical protein
VAVGTLEATGDCGVLLVAHAILLSSRQDPLEDREKRLTAVEQAVDRLSLEPTVSAASWSVEPVVE